MFRTFFIYYFYPFIFVGVGVIQLRCFEFALVLPFGLLINSFIFVRSALNDMTRSNRFIAELRIHLFDKLFFRKKILHTFGYSKVEWFRGQADELKLNLIWEILRTITIATNTLTICANEILENCYQLLIVHLVDGYLYFIHYYIKNYIGSWN